MTPSSYPQNGAAMASGAAPHHAYTLASRLRQGPPPPGSRRAPGFVPTPTQRMSDPHPCSYSPTTAGQMSQHAPAQPSDWRAAGPAGSRRSPARSRLAEGEEGRWPDAGVSTGRARGVPSGYLYHA